MMRGRKCLVVGAGLSGIASVELLEHMGAEVVLYDSNEKLTPKDLMDRLPESSKALCVTGALPQHILEETQTAVISPGVPSSSPLVEGLLDRKVEVIGEIELAFRADKGKVIAITGTNGKTTTTTLVGEIMKAHLGEDKVFVVGNIGNPYTKECLKTTADTVSVVEVSSFQLENIEEFHPVVSAILNITPDHLDRYPKMSYYIDAKECIALRQTAEETCVLNFDNEYTSDFGDRCRPSVIYFSVKHLLEEGYCLEGDKITRVVQEEAEALLDIHKDMKLVGLCNVENVMAAIAITEAMGVPIDTILKVIKEFQPVEHRIEFVATKEGVDYYNDSKGTNPDAAVQGIKAMSKPTILIGGGYDKGNEYDDWVDSFEGRVKWLVLIGQTKEKIADCARRHGFDRIKFADTFEECLKLCTELAEEGDAVLLSPACASWGMFPNYEVRGKRFKEYVNGLV